MKKYTILIALIIGLAVFLMRWFRAFTPIANYEIHFIPLWGIYWGMKLHFKKIKTSNPEYQITFLRTFWLGLQMSLIASVFTTLLCFLFIPYSIRTMNMFSPVLLDAFPFMSTFAYGVLVSILCSAVFVYFKPIKIKHDTDFPKGMPSHKLHSGQFLY